MKDKTAEIIGIVSALDTAESADQAIQTYLLYAKQFGFENYLISHIVNPTSDLSKHAMMHSNWPEPILANRFAGMNLLHDPVVKYGMKTHFPFLWETAYQHASKYGKLLMDSARDFQIATGMTFPMRRPGAPLGGISLGGEKIELSEQDRGMLQLASLHCYSRLEALHPPYPQERTVSLSPQEIEVLQFSTGGKTAWEISAILNISESGVKDALKRARIKLDAVNTLHACSKAISRDLILP